MRDLVLASAAAATVLAGLGAGSPAFAQAGSYQRSCRNYSSSGGTLTAECADGQGRYHRSSINAGQCRGDISNNNGMLACQGAQASGGELVDGGRADNRDRDRGGGNNAAGLAAGAVAGALLGGALGNNNAAPPPPPAYAGPPGPPPVYGDPRYGDPRYDSRYAQGGWGYGRRAGEWVPIRARADWLDMRIERALRQGRLGRRDARDLRRELGAIEDMEDRYSRDGRLGPRERADLDRRFDDLSARIRFEARR